MQRARNGACWGSTALPIPGSLRPNHWGCCHLRVQRLCLSFGMTAAMSHDVTFYPQGHSHVSWVASLLYPAQFRSTPGLAFRSVSSPAKYPTRDPQCSRAALKATSCPLLHIRHPDGYLSTPSRIQECGKLYGELAWEPWMHRCKHCVAEK